MARTKVTVLVDWKDNAGPVDMMFGDIDLQNLEDDSLFNLIQADGVELHYLRLGAGIRLQLGIRLQFNSKAQRDQWVTLAAIKYGLQ